MTRISVRKGLNAELDSLAVQFISEMLGWTAGENSSGKIKVQLTVPVEFKKEQAIQLHSSDTSTYTEVPLMPTFQGSKNSDETDKFLFNYLKSRIKESKIKTNGIVYLSFVVNQKGKMSDIIIRKGVNEELDQLAIKYISEMTNWTPGELLGKKVRVQYTVPIRFTK